MHIFGAPTFICQFCQAHMWYQERVGILRETNAPTFFLCYKKRMIKLPPNPSTPTFLDSLLSYDNGQKSAHFGDNVKVYNSMFQFSFLVGKIDDSFGNRSRPYVFKING